MSERTVVQATSRPWLLAIDTSTEQAGVALYDGERLATTQWPAGRNQTVSVLTQIDRLRETMEIEVQDVAVVAVSVGPGAFSGLRVGISLGKGFVLGCDWAMLGISSLEIVAWPWVATGLPVVAVVPAGRERLIWQMSRGGRGERPRTGTVEELRDALGAMDEPRVVAGELSSDQRAALVDEANALIPSRAAAICSAASLADLGWRRFMAGERDDAVLLQPVYVHTAPEVAPPT